MSDDAQRWKDKYLGALEQQEALERRWERRLDLLRRGLVRSSLAAEGADKAVDQCMQEMREILRREDMDAALGNLIPRLEKAVLGSEQRRQQRADEAATALARLVEQLQQLRPPREVRKALKALAKQLSAASGQGYRLPTLLSQLSNLQDQALRALDASAREQPGLLQRLFGGRGETGAAAGEQAAAWPVRAAEAPAVVAVPVAAVVVKPGPPATSTALDSLPLPPGLLAESAEAGSRFDLPGSEPGYSAVAPHIAESVLGLLEQLELPPHHQPQGEALRQRVQGQLNWYELVPMLDDLAVLVLAVSDSGQREFSGYLKRLNERLATFIDSLGLAQDGYSASIENARSFDQALREQVGDLQHSVHEAADLESLKQALEQRLDGLLQTVGAHQRQRDKREDELAERLQGLMRRVAEMEDEAQQFREHLEEQRQKSLLDPLTGLPNRAAWSERLALETARRLRYGGELLLAVLDVDHFKLINDGYGHLAGDRVLTIIAGELHKRLRKTDFLARYGGEEFALLIPATPLEGGVQLLETLRAAVAACPFHFKGEPLTVTFSAGIAELRNDETIEATFERADQALYRAKDAGRNRVVQAT